MADNMSESGSEIRELINSRDVSKKVDVEGRQATAAEIRKAREARSVQKDQILSDKVREERLGDIVDISFRKKQELEKERAKKLESFLVKVKSKLWLPDAGVEKIDEQLLNARGEIAESADWQGEASKKRRESETILENLPDPKEIVVAYYEKVQNTPLTNEEKRTMLTPEQLADLSLDEYIQLWKRLNPHFLSHVTRQGFRDHNAMMYHSAGLQEFHDGFNQIVEGGGLLEPPMRVEGLRSLDEESVSKWMGDWILGADDGDSAKERFSALMNFSFGAAPKYPDKTAVHFAAQTVADDFYGAEKGNEVFFIFPSDVVASQNDFAFNGWEKDFTRPQSELKWNDVFVWPDDKRGIELNAGLVFLPERTMVDPDTGSRYASETKIVDGKEKRVMIEDQGRVNKFLEWGKRMVDPEDSLFKLLQEYKTEKRYNRQQDLKEDWYGLCVKSLAEFGFQDDTAFQLAQRTLSSSYDVDGLSSEKLEEVIRRVEGNWKLAENPINSKDYWELKFVREPGKRPKHVVYYSGDPNTAVYKLQQQNGIGRADVSGQYGKLLGFDDKFVDDMLLDPRANRDRDELTKIGLGLIEKKFGSVDRLIPPVE